ncbi:hypothetical protein N0V93_002187 [Gnomoniopsis smithogilvyi]|uniref:Heterokaryon incompatibility domain-containing protein n=1 Tax=Gnomoniopsis smithogilvyi TaxID=1191159 RepID=A0A9W9CYU5_9PEZI|nr:hypothetical protein N0V93_002187 [Gnomoniopsis smithogilvyi]
MAHPPEEIPLFAYDRLPNAATHIRLLQILALDESQSAQVHAKLTVWPRATAPPYHAISYTWGDPNDTAVVLVNAKRMVVRRNCEYVLKQAKWYENVSSSSSRSSSRKVDKGKGYFWCDAICIDQGNNLEKGSQVAMMGEIYKGAERVLACVGEGGEGSEMVFEEMRRRDAWLLRAVAALESSRAVQASKKHEDGFLRIGFNLPPARLGTINSWLLWACSALWLRMRQRAFTWPQRTQALLSLAKRDFFRRVWIYQEFFLGADILLCCGRDTAPLRVLYGMLEVVYGESKRTRRHGLGSRGRKQGMTGLGECEDMVEAGAVRGLGNKYFWEAIYTASTLDCADARDRVYAMLSLVDWRASERPIFPDYERDAFELGVEVLRRMGTFHRFVVIRSLGLASSTPSRGLLEARRRRRISMVEPPEYKADAPEIPESVSDQTGLLTQSLGLRVSEVGGRLHFDLPAASGVALSLHRWSKDLDRKRAMHETQQKGATLTVLVPLDTEPGDWCIFYRAEFFRAGWLVLVVRCVDDVEDGLIDKSDHSHRFMIRSKGLAFVEAEQDPVSEHSTGSNTAEEQFVECLRQWGIPFDVHCSAEDSLCLESSFISEHVGEPDLLQDGLLAEYFDTRGDSGYNNGKKNT